MTSALILAAVIAAPVQATPAVEGEIAVVRASGVLGCNGFHKSTMRGIVGLLKGDVQLRSESCPSSAMIVTEVISGRALDASFGKRPYGANSVTVYFLNDAAAGLPAGDRGDDTLNPSQTRIWTLHALPSGDFVVWNIKDTPFSREVAAKRRANNLRIGQGLGSRDARLQYEALTKWKASGGLFSQIPLIIGLIDSESPIPHRQTIGEFARRELARTARFLDDHSTVSPYDDADDYRKWYADRVNAPAFLPASVESGDLRELISVTMNQSQPEFSASPDGRRALLGFTRLDRPIGGAKNGIVIFDLTRKTGEKKFLYKVPLEAVNIEPQRIEVAWTKDKVGIAWLEQWYDSAKGTLRFLAVDPAGDEVPVAADLKIRDVWKLALSRHGKDWIISYVTRKDDAAAFNADKVEVFIVKVDGAGRLQGNPTSISLPIPLNFAGARVVSSMSLIETPRGAVMAVASGMGPFLIFLDDALKPRKIVPFVEPDLAYTYSDLSLAWNGKEFCATWIGYTNEGARLFASLFDVDGKPVRRPIMLADSVESLGFSSMPHPIPCGDAFAVLWADKSDMPHSVMLAKISGATVSTQARRVFLGKSVMSPLALGIDGNAAKVMLFDRNSYPYQVVLKEVKMPD